MADRLLGALDEYYGYDSFRPQQRETIEHVMAGGDSLVLMPTGGGKSLCYQLPALLSDGLTVVVSPLIALMHDQVQALRRAGADAQYLNSTMSLMQSAQVERLVADGSVSLLYVAPERVNTDRFRDLLERRNPSLIAIDEAHCISEWGHEFRPDYRVLRRLTERFVDVPTVACTATATPQVQRDIVEQLDRPRMQTFITGFMRENLTLRIVPKRKSMDRLIARLEQMPGEAAIVYSQSRKSTEETAERLRKSGIKAEFYHAGVNGDARHAVQDRFLSGETPVICATIAFGMGIDKPDIRLVAHLDMPSSIESYYQETGRAGRDGEPAECLMFYTKGVWHQQKYFIDQLTDEAEREQRINRLRTMMNFCEQSQCRWSRIIRYFGEESAPSACGHCDNCLGDSVEDVVSKGPRPVDPDDPPSSPGGVVRPLSEPEEDLYEALRQTRMRLAQDEGVSAFVVAGNRDLAALARARPGNLRELQQVKGFGSRRAEKYGDDLLETIGQHMDERVHDGPEASLPLQTQMPAGGEASRDKQPPEMWQQRFNALGAWRTMTSGNEGCDPSDLLTFSAMRQISETTPGSIEELAGVEGVGALAVERFADELAAILGIQEAEPAPPPPARTVAEPAAQPVEQSSSVPSWQTTLELYESGHTMLAIAERRMLSPGTVASHLINAMRHGHDIDLEPVLPSVEQIQEVRRQLSMDADASITAIHDRIELRLSRAELQLVVAHIRPPELLGD